MQPARALIVTLLLVVVLASPRAASADTHSEDVLLPLFADVLRRGGMGLVHTEAAAFIVDQGAGLVGCMAWPASPDPKRQSYRGPVPYGTIAVVHSHPGAARVPSGQDIREARRSGVPFYVVTRDSIWRADPDGSTREILRRDRWWGEPAAAGSPCRSTAVFIAETLRSGRTLRWLEGDWGTVNRVVTKP